MAGDETDVPSFRADDFLLSVLDKFQWLLEFQAEKDARNKAPKAMYGKQAWHIIFKQAQNKSKEQHGAL